MRTFVFITNIPDFLLQPIYKNDGKDGNDAGAKKTLAPSKFDLRYERLRRLLVEHSSGVMLVMHLETKGYALALYASEGEALAACKTDIIPEQPGQKFRPLRLRILEREKPRPPEPVYNPYLTVEGEEVRKVDLADTRGLELVYRGRALARWCPRTLAGEDCYFGVSCLKLHRAAVQRTVRKRPRIDEADAEASLSPAQRLAVQEVLGCVKKARAALTPQSLALPGCLYVPVSQAEAEALCGLSADADLSTSTAATGDDKSGNKNNDSNSFSSGSSHQAAVYDALCQRLGAAMASAASPPTGALRKNSVAYFPRLSCPGGAPWEWTVESAEGRRVLRRDCPLPANGAPTPLERDLYIQRLWYHMNQRNRCTTPQEVLRMLQGSRRVREALLRRRREHCAADPASDAAPPVMASSRADENGEGGADLPPPLAVTEGHENKDVNEKSAVMSASSDTELFICLEPWLYLPTVGGEVSVFLERGGQRVRGVVQRYGQLRLMTSAALLATATTPSVEEATGSEASAAAAAGEDVDALLTRYAVLNSGNDSVAEDALAHELRAFQRCFAAAVGDLCNHLQQHPTTTGGAAAAWCVHLAVKLPLGSADAYVTRPASPANTTAGLKSTSATPSAVLLSCTPYHRALEECSLYAALAPPAPAENGETEGRRVGGKVDVTWNTQRHPYIPLFSRDLLEKLRADATD